MRTFQTQAELHAKSQSDYQNLRAQGTGAIQDFEDHLDRLTMQKGTGQSVDFFIKTLRDAIAKLQKNVSADAQRAAYHAAIASKYERTARYPWLSIEPDDPAPESAHRLNYNWRGLTARDDPGSLTNCSRDANRRTPDAHQ